MKVTGKRLAIMITATVIGWILIIGIISNKPDDSNNNSNPQYNTALCSADEKGYAWAVAEKEVKESLKAPSTANFPTYNDGTITKSGSRFTVIGYVDAENSYGAEIRNNFVVIFEKTGSETYRVISVDIDE